VIDQVYSTLQEKWQAEGKSEVEIIKLWTKYVDNHLVKMLYGFEVMMASYAIAHLKVSLKLRQTGYLSHHKTPFNILLTNTLEGVVEQKKLEDTAIAEEAERAREVKLQVGFTVIVGNPPYKGHSANKSTHLDQLLKEYKKEPSGAKLKERNPKWLNDDYVKFIRFAQTEISKTGCGVHSFITAHSWMDNPTFRGMRASILREYCSIKVLDLHGNINRGEVCPDGSKDENVFNDGTSGIKQGVAIFSFSKLNREQDNESWKTRKVTTSDLWGLTCEKFEILTSHYISRLDLQIFQPRLNLLIFKNSDEALAEDYEKGWSVIDIFPVNSVGIATHRDKFSIALNKEEIEDRFRDFLNSNNTNEEIRKKYFGEDKEGAKFRAGDNRDWKMDIARQVMMSDVSWIKSIKPILYRPFDKRVVMYHRSAIDFGRWEVMDNLLEVENLALISARSNKSTVMDHFLVSNSPSEVKCGESTTGSAVFPLYLSKLEGLGFDEIHKDDEGRYLNINPDFISDFESKTYLKLDMNKSGRSKKIFSPIELMSYIYAVFYSPIYRAKYIDHLRVDFPRVPYPKDIPYFFTMVNFGSELIKLHKLDFTPNEYTDLEYDLSHLKGESIEFVKYKKKNSVVSIRLSSDSSINDVPIEIIEFKIGGHKVLDKFLKARVGCVLDQELLLEIQRILVSILRTKQIVTEINKEY